MINYPIVIHKERKSDYGVTVPDLPGCYSAGTTVDEAIAMAREAIELHLEGMIEEGLPIPVPASIEEHRGNPDYVGGTWAVVSVDQATLRVRAKRINITMPERILDAVDRFAEQRGETRSGLLVRAVADYMGREANMANRTASRRQKTSQQARAQSNSSTGHPGVRPVRIG